MGTVSESLGKASPGWLLRILSIRTRLCEGLGSGHPGNVVRDNREDSLKVRDFMVLRYSSQWSEGPRLGERFP